MAFGGWPLDGPPRLEFPSFQHLNQDAPQFDGWSGGPSRTKSWGHTGRHFKHLFGTEMSTYPSGEIPAWYYNRSTFHIGIQIWGFLGEESSHWMSSLQFSASRWPWYPLVISSMAGKSPSYGRYGSMIFPSQDFQLQTGYALSCTGPSRGWLSRCRCVLGRLDTVGRLRVQWFHWKNGGS